MKLYLPIFLVVFSNIIYHICAKSCPEALNPIASLIVTYTIGGVFSAILYFFTAHNPNLIQEFQHLNWVPFVLGLAIVGLEAGNLYMYKAGWNVNTGYMVQSAILAVALLALGYFLYNEAIDYNKLIGVLLCMLGLFFLNK